MATMKKEYSFHSTRLARVIDPRKQTVKVYTSPAGVLPGLTLALSALLSRTRRKKTG